VEIGPAGSVLLVTGSNMSGKSTLLRAVGVNAVLAQAGAPVCAESLVMPPVVLATSMRIRDSLVDGVSFYMAELMRLKEIVDLARGAVPRGDRLLLYLLDEILLGTNSRERHLAVVRVLEHLLRCGAIGAVSTHDLELATTEPLTEACRCVHFSETLHDAHAERPMTFDYKLRSGVATTSNALKLLEIVGLGGPRPGPS
jgi:DNA mismatch repair ATPase MutS